ncbi:hypothetical protein F4803DRAFT_510276 [Xylaria telfairii]|nr:hypothetical protein F4803DRAFT_510276 [Xylaria telfairii]
MHSAFATLISLAVLVTAAPPNATANNNTLFACGNPPPTEEELAIHAQFFEEERLQTDVQAAAIPTVNVYFHLVASSKKPADGWVDDSRIEKQMKVLSNSYESHGITFKRAGTTRTVNAAWAQGNNSDEMKAKLRNGSYNDLNIYLHHSLPGNAAGVCTFPKAVGGPGTYNFDGCQILTESLPDGRPYNGLNDGKAGVHEVGHWFGLLHTFQGGCEAPGDFVDDTPFEKSPPPNGGCPTGLNSCPDKPGNDPIHNHMDYTSGKCKTRFTPGQQKRMHSQWAKFRAGK